LKNIGFLIRTNSTGC